VLSRVGGIESWSVRSVQKEIRWLEKNDVRGCGLYLQSVETLIFALLWSLIGGLQIGLTIGAHMLMVLLFCPCVSGP